MSLTTLAPLRSTLEQTPADVENHDSFWEFRDTDDRFMAWYERAESIEREEWMEGLEGMSLLQLADIAEEQLSNLESNGVDFSFLQGPGVWV